MSLLVVEDEEDVRAMVAECLRGEGYDVCEAANTAAAKTILHAHAATIEFVITDVRMPGKEDGLQLANNIRQNYSKIPVLLASGNITEAEAAGNLFIMKPFKLARLVMMVRDILAQRR